MRIADAAVQVELVDRQNSDKRNADRMRLGGAVDGHEVAGGGAVEAVTAEVVITDFDGGERVETPAAANRPRGVVVIERRVVESRQIGQIGRASCRERV